MMTLNKRLNTTTTKPHMSRRALYIKANLLSPVVDNAPSNYLHHFIFKNIKIVLFLVFIYINLCYFFIL